MKIKLIAPAAATIADDQPDFSESMLADPGRHGFTTAELAALTVGERRIGMTKEFLQARAKMRLKQAKRRPTAA